HGPVVGERRAVVPTGSIFGDPTVRIVNANKVELLAVEDPQISRRRGRMVVAGADDGNAPRSSGDRLRCRVARLEGPEKACCGEAADRALPHAFEEAATVDAEHSLSFHESLSHPLTVGHEAPDVSTAHVDSLAIDEELQAG